MINMTIFCSLLTIFSLARMFSSISTCRVAVTSASVGGVIGFVFPTKLLMLSLHTRWLFYRRMRERERECVCGWNFPLYKSSSSNYCLQRLNSVYLSLLAYAVIGENAPKPRLSLDLARFLRERPSQ